MTARGRIANPCLEQSHQDFGKLELIKPTFCFFIELVRSAQFQQLASTVDEGLRWPEI